MIRTKIISAFSSILFISACVEENAPQQHGSPFLKSSVTIPQQIKLSITPGKPNADTEQITYQREANGCVLVVNRLNASDELVASFSKKDDCVLLDKLWQKLSENGVLDFQAESLDAEVFDYGAKLIFLQWQVQGESELLSKTLSWIGPIERESELNFLFDELGEQFVESEFELYYF